MWGVPWLHLPTPAERVPKGEGAQDRTGGKWEREAQGRLRGGPEVTRLGERWAAGPRARERQSLDVAYTYCVYLGTQL